MLKNTNEHKYPRIIMNILRNMDYLDYKTRMS